jgi:aminoglycoside phosphotransferase (APT) family kinase protein
MRLVPRSTASLTERLPAGLSDAEDFAARSDLSNTLLAYLRRRLSIPDLGYAQPPTEFPDGWETYTYAFQLKSAGPLPAGFGQSMVVRIYAGPPGVPRARHEYQVQSHLWQRGYPVAEPLLLEEACAPLGGPFLVMAQCPGCTMLRSLLRQPWRIWRSPVRMAEAHARLHRLPPADFPAPPGTLLARRFREMAVLLETYDLHQMRPGLDWLLTHCPPPPDRPSIVHLDFHPLSLIHTGDRALAVLDWVEADVGDRHADVGTTLMLMECVTAGAATASDHFWAWSGRYWLVRWYRKAYQRLLPLDAGRLAYYRAWAAFHRLCTYGRWLRAGPGVTGSKPTVLRHLSPVAREWLQRYFRKWTGVGVRL